MIIGFTLGLFLFCLSASALIPVKEMTFQDCHSLFELEPSDGAHCFYEVGWYQDREAEARRELRALRQENPENLDILINLTYLEPDPKQKEKLYLFLTSEFRDRQDLGGELQTRDSYWRFLLSQGRLLDAEDQLQRMEDLRDQAVHWQDRLRIDLALARYTRDYRNEFTRAQDLVRPYEKRLSSSDNYRLELRAWILLGETSWDLGMASSAYYYFLKAGETARGKGAFGEEAHHLVNALLALIDRTEESSDPEIRREAIEFAREVLDKSEKAEEGPAITRALLVLGNLHRGAAARPYYEKCVKLTAGRTDYIKEHRSCKFALAANLATQSPEKALALVRELRTEKPNMENLLNQVYERHSELRVLWKILEFKEAWRASMETLELLEELRDVQPEAQGRARSVAAWGMSYPWLAGLVLEHFKEAGSAEDLESALMVIERMRSRLLLEELEVRAQPPEESPALQEWRNRLNQRLLEKARIQWRLRVPETSQQERNRAGARLDVLHDQINGIRKRISQISGRFQDLRLPRFATIGEVQESLAEHEALLSFQLAPWESAVEAFAGGSWLIVITPYQADAYRLPDGDKIADRVDMFTGLLEKGRSESGLSNRLYNDLMGDALEDLPHHITDLIVIPDKALHRLPFTALRPTEDAPPLATRYRFSRVPSVTLWLRRWRELEAPSVALQPALVLADPGSFETEDAEGDGNQIASLMRDGDPFRDDSYGPLPFAQQEGWSLRRHLGPGTEMLTGFKASERFLRTTANLDRFGILHFAAHAIANEEEPDRAGVVLAPDPDPPANGANGEPADGIYDGMLQFNEIVDLGFAGRTVVLSACHSARGQILRGEGVFDLARAFFEGGARAVVGSLWRLEDKATARFFDDFYRHLAKGVSLSEALHRAQKDQIDRGAPPSVWAGIVVIGDGSLVPVPSRNGRHHPAYPIAVALVLLAVAVGVAARRSS